MRFSLLLLLLTGLASAAPLTHLEVVTDPPGAELYLEVSGRARYEKYIGRSGEEILLDLSHLEGASSFRVTARLPGYRDRTETLGLHFTGRWPAEGALLLEPTTFWVGVRTAIFHHPLAVALTAGLLASGLTWALRRESRVRGQLERLRRMESLRASERLDAPPRLGSWRLLELIGRGGLASVYRAVPDHSLELTEAVALKVLDQSLDPEVRARYRREVQISARLRHPHVVTLLDFGEQDGLLFIVLELLEGGTLRHCIRPGGLTQDEAVTLLRPLFAGLQYAHDRGVVHRDLKPENVLLGPSGQVKLADFGLARHRSAAALTGPEQLLGTPAYVAPELLHEKPDFSPASDQYALGVIAYELLAGQPPFAGNLPVQVLLQQLREPAPTLALARPDLDDALVGMVDRMLERDPEARYACVAAAARDLPQTPLSGPPSQ